MAKRRRRIPRYLQDAAQPTSNRNRIPADLSQQAANNSYDPPTYYEDKPFVCRDCGAEEVWTAEQQKWWYEVAKGTIYSTAVRCRACRQRHRAAQAPRSAPSAGGTQFAPDAE